MSIFSKLFDALTGDGGEEKQQTADRPCANCPSTCAIAGDACEVCAPYKKKLIDAVYYVDHLEEFRARYEVTGLAGESGTVTCPYCGGKSENHQVCEYCGSRLTEDTETAGKIKVEKASDIPNPIMEAQDIIFERYNTVIRKYAQNSSGSGGTGTGTDGSTLGSTLGDILSGLFGEEESSESESALGAKMSEEEIREAASLYGVSLGDYLTGLDNGKYLTLAGRKAAQQLGTSGQTDYTDYSPASAGVPGLAGIGTLASALLSGRGKLQGRPERRPPREPERRPDRRPGGAQDSRDARRPADAQFSGDGRRPVGPGRQQEDRSRTDRSRDHRSQTDRFQSGGSRDGRPGQSRDGGRMDRGDRGPGSMPGRNR